MKINEKGTISEIIRRKGEEDSLCNRNGGTFFCCFGLGILLKRTNMNDRGGGGVDRKRNCRNFDIVRTERGWRFAKDTNDRNCERSRTIRRR